jgi:SAM-dependent methyltransferase
MSKELITPPDSATVSDRQAHAVLDLPSRAWKGLKIERLLNLQSRYGKESKTIRLLDVGTGSGGIAYYFAHHSQLNCIVDAVDIVDNRQVFEGISFHLVSDTSLPFDDETFDIILSNHVIEHVGQIAEQKRHLAELSRVLRPDGVIYLAVPNRWMLIEPHYRLVFLSWLPVAWRTSWLRFWGKGEVYDCLPFAMRPLERLLQESGFHFRNVSVEAMKLFFEIEKPHLLLTGLLQRIHNSVLNPLRPCMPTLCYVLNRNRM